MITRKIALKDYNSYIILIKSDISREDYNAFLNVTLSNSHFILVADVDNAIIGSGALFIEKKMTYGGCKMGHIENVLVDEKYRGKGYGEQLVKELLTIAKENKCYRVDLNCGNELEGFYNKNGLENKHICMNLYFKENFNK